MRETKENCERNHQKSKETNQSFWKEQKITKNQNKELKTPINKEPEKTVNEDDDEYKLVKNKKKKFYIPVTGISPGEGMRDDTNKEPEISWAKTTYKTIAQKNQK